MRSVACGRAHTLVVGCDGRLYAFGEGAHGQLGHSGGGPFGRPLRCGGSLASLRVDEAWASPLADVSFARARHPTHPAPRPVLLVSRATSCGGECPAVVEGRRSLAGARRA